MNTVFFGASELVIPILEALNEQFNLQYVFTTEKDKSDPVASFCIKKDIPYSSVTSKKELSLVLNNIKDLELGIVADFGIIIPKNVLELFPKGIVNIHPSLLPRYRGATPVQTAILNGDKKTGISFIKMDEQLDHGEIIRQFEYDILDTDTFQTLCKRLFKESANSLKQVLSTYSSDLKSTSQDHKHATFTKILKREDGYIDFSKFSSIKNIDKISRAYFPWPGAWTKLKLGGQDKIIKFLPEHKIQVEGKKEMAYKDFINGYPNANSNLLNFLKQND